jgi:predicted GIY-YIG superfamily endonuclease
MKGVYALYYEHDLLYVGQTFHQNLGDRLKQHLKDEKATRWDSFSWYGIMKVLTTKRHGLFRLQKPTKKSHRMSQGAVIKAYEAWSSELLIPH